MTKHRKQCFHVAGKGTNYARMSVRSFKLVELIFASGAKTSRQAVAQPQGFGKAFTLIQLFLIHQRR